MYQVITKLNTIRRTFAMRKLGMGLAAAVLAVSTVFGGTALKNVSQVKAADTDYTYVYAGLSWEEYWNAEGVYNASNTQSSDVKDDHGEYDKGGFDTVSRATYNHGLHRGSFQCEAVIFDTEGKTYDVAYWTSEDKAVKLVLTDGSKCTYNSKAKTLTFADGTTVTLDHYEVKGLKYVPVKVKTSDYEDFKSKYNVVENGGTLEGGYTENNLKAYSETAEVTADTNGLKEAVKEADGTYSFGARINGTASGVKDSSLKKAADITVNLRSTDTQSNITGSYGEFLRVDLTGNYGDLGANLQAVKWTYYGQDSTRTNALATFGTKFAADNWMHKVNGIQLGLTDSYRCQLPEGTDGTGYWTVTVYALGYEDYSFDIQTEKNNLYMGDEEEADTTKLAEAVNAAKALNEADYTKESWDAMQVELREAQDALSTPGSTDTQSNITGSYGEFLRVDLTGNYGDLGANLQAVKWTYYGQDSTRTNALATFGTKFAADNWMHKVNGIQLGLTDSYRCQLPEGTDGTGYWTVTVYALGYEDYSFDIQTEKNNLYMGDEEEADTTKLAEAVNAAKALNEADYTKESWDAMQVELREAQDALSTPGSAASVAEATDHLNAAMAALVKVSTDDGSTSDTEASGTDSSDTAGSSEASSTDSTSSSAEGTSTESTSTVKTYDAANVYAWFAAAVLAAGLGVCVYVKKNNRIFR